MADPIPWHRDVGKLVVGLILAAFLIIIFVPNFVSPPRRRSSPINACINNLRQLDGATEQWRLEYGRGATEVPTQAQVSIYIKGGFPSCPEQGAYTINGTNGLPVCTVPGHVLR